MLPSVTILIFDITLYPYRHGLKLYSLLRYVPSIIAVQWPELRGKLIAHQQFALCMKISLLSHDFVSAGYDMNIYQVRDSIILKNEIFATTLTSVCRQITNVVKNIIVCHAVTIYSTLARTLYSERFQAACTLERSNW